MKRRFFFFFLAAALCLTPAPAVLAAETETAGAAVGDVRLYGDGDFAVEFQTADGTAVTPDENGQYPGAARLTMTYQDKAVPGSQYLVLIMNTDTARPSQDDIQYIDQKKAEGTDIAFDVYPMPMADGQRYDVRLSGDDGSFSTLRSVVSFTYTSHVPGEPVRENEIPATCTTAGSYDEVVYCTECRAEISRVTRAVERLSHSFHWVVTTEPSETAPGVRSYVCEICGTVDKTQPFPNKGDLNADGRRDDMDLILLLQCIHGTQGPEVLLSRADIDGSGFIDYDDLYELMLTVKGKVSPDSAALFLKHGCRYEAFFVLKYCLGLCSEFPALASPVPAPALDGTAEEVLPAEEAKPEADAAVEAEAGTAAEAPADEPELTEDEHDAALLPEPELPPAPAEPESGEPETEGD